MFKDRIKEARKKVGLSQEKLGSLLGVSKQTMSDYERGYSEPDMAKVSSLMNILNVDANFLWQDEMRINNNEESLSKRALEVARAYDSMSEYGKSLIDKIIENEKKYKIVKAVPVIGEAINDGSVETKHAAKQEQRELEQEENHINSEKI